MEAQLDFSPEEAQRNQVLRLADFEFEIPAEHLDLPAGARNVFTTARLDSLNYYIRHVVNSLAGKA